MQYFWQPTASSIQQYAIWHLPMNILWLTRYNYIRNFSVKYILLTVKYKSRNSKWTKEKCSFQKAYFINGIGVTALCAHHIWNNFHISKNQLNDLFWVKDVWLAHWKCHRSFIPSLVEYCQLNVPHQLRNLIGLCPRRVLGQHQFYVIQSYL